MDIAEVVRGMVDSRSVDPSVLNTEVHDDWQLVSLIPKAPGPVAITIRVEKYGALVSVDNSQALEFTFGDKRDEQELLDMITAALDGALEVFEERRKGQAIATAVRYGSTEFSLPKPLHSLLTRTVGQWRTYAPY